MIYSGYDQNDSDDDGGTSAIADYDMGLAEVLADPVRFDKPALRHAICVATQSEQAAYQEAVAGNAVVPEGESSDFYIPSCIERHANCKMCGSGPRFLLDEDLKDLTVDLNVLGVCRQLYEEANHLLWTTNTFSFEDSNSFAKFFASLNPAQKRKLASIHISADIGGTGYSYYRTGLSHQASNLQRARWDSNYWGKALKMSNLNMLRGVQTLFVCIRQSFDCVNRHFGNHTTAGDEVIEEANKADLEPILRLRALSVRHVTVVVSDFSEQLERHGWSAYRWTVAKKNEFAESIRALLVDPKGAESVKTEVEAAKLARNTEIRDSTAVILKDYKEILKCKRIEARSAVHLASKAEAEAELAKQNADQEPGKRLYKAKKRDAHKLENKAIHARTRANNAVQIEKNWRERVDKERGKHKRAMISLGATPEEIEDEEELERLLDGVNENDDMDFEQQGVAQGNEYTFSEDDYPLSPSPEPGASDEEEED